MKKAVFLTLGILVLLAGCAQATAVPPTQLPTDTPEPTATSEPQPPDPGIDETITIYRSPT